MKKIKKEIEEQSSLVVRMKVPNIILVWYCGLPTSMRTSLSNDNSNIMVFKCQNYGLGLHHSY